MDRIRTTSLQAPNQDFIVARLAIYLAAKLGIQVEFISRPPWQERDRLLDAGEIQAGWICGLPYVRKIDQENLPLELLAAPVFKAERYDDRPIYYSDVVVRRESRFQHFADLRGAAWAYNEPGSQWPSITRFSGTRAPPCRYPRRPRMRVFFMNPS